VALIVLDASVLIGLLDPTDPLHGAATDALRRHAADDLRIPTSAYAECLAGPAKRRRLSEAKAAIGSLMSELAVLTEDIAEMAAELRAHHRALRLPDAVVIATGDVLGADAVLTGDARWRRVSRRVRVIRPA
jgi:predicted nucleic acid-binding protein